MPAFTDNCAENIQLLAAFLRQNMAVMITTVACHTDSVNVTTLPDLSASLPTFSGNDTPTIKHWTEELERAQRQARDLARAWENPAVAICQGKLRGVAADWYASTGQHLTTWFIWKVDLQERLVEVL